MDNSIVNRNVLKAVTNQPIRETSNQNSINFLFIYKFRILQIQIQSNDDLSYQPLVTISDNDNSDEDDFISPIHKLTKNELREKLKLFRQDNNSSRNNINNTLLNHNNDNYDADDIEFHTYQSTKCSICCYQY
ncbi:unnamed protein product [Rotaria sordida]|uniref:Uncharacterized protein n=1 Tax=Rotaria sordida TaxID=392033 RepID=A0A813WRF0_9BILA|nr:unnamed protein product [Rotaria sordida]